MFIIFKNLYLLVNLIFNFFGLSLSRHPLPALRRRLLLMNNCEINCIIDVGANIGQYALEIYRNGFTGEVHSIEPLSDSYKTLTIQSQRRHGWYSYNYGIGSIAGEMPIKISQNFVSSSFLPISEAHTKAEKSSVIVGEEIVSIKRLDTFITELDIVHKSLMLKIDTQGYEDEVLRSAADSIKLFKLIQVEMSISKMYDGEKSYLEIIEYLASYGFKLVSIETGFYDKLDGQLYQFDGIFLNEMYDKGKD